MGISTDRHPHFHWTATNEIVIDLRAVPGPGNLLGNLLCAILGLLDQTRLNVALINQILALINNLLTQL